MIGLRPFGLFLERYPAHETICRECHREGRTHREGFCVQCIYADWMW